MKNVAISFLFVVFITTLSFAQDEEKKEKIKDGWSFGAVPAIAYDSDIGFKYGGLVNFYDYGDGSYILNTGIVFIWNGREQPKEVVSINLHTIQNI